MHRSRLAGLSVDCQDADLGAASRFWCGALGMPSQGRDEPTFVRLDASARDLSVEVQRVDHPSRVHLDIESDDVEAEVRRLEALGARISARVKTWVVMEAPTGQRFCVVPAGRSLEGAPGANLWP